MASNTSTRRSFLAKSAGLTAAAAGVPTILPGFPSIVLGRVLGANEKIGIGLIGCGGRGNHHLRTIAQLAGAGEAVEIVAACDVYRPRLEATAKAHNVKGTMKHKELLQDPRVDAVCIATPDHIHGPQAIDAVEAGEDVYCEKPLTHWRQFELTKKMAMLSYLERVAVRFDPAAETMVV